MVESFEPTDREDDTRDDDTRDEDRELRADGVHTDDFDPNAPTAEQATTVNERGGGAATSARRPSEPDPALVDTGQVGLPIAHDQPQPGKADTQTKQAPTKRSAPGQTDSGQTDSGQTDPGQTDSGRSESGRRKSGRQDPGRRREVRGGDLGEAGGFGHVRERPKRALTGPADPTNATDLDSAANPITDGIRAPGGVDTDANPDRDPDVGDPGVGGVDGADGEPPLTIQQDVIIGLDVSGTSFDAGIVTTRGDLINRSSRPIEPDVGPQSHFAAVVQVITEQLDAARDAQCRVRAIGIASPGPITPNCEQVSPLSIPAWRDFPLRRHLIELAGLPVYGDLDAKALALSEGWLGVARGRSSFATIMVSASIGGGLVIDGDLLDGANGNAGHIGHVIVEPGGRRCRCGARGCLDAEASGLAIETITGRPTSEPSYDIMRQTGTLVGRAAAIVCNSLDLNFVVVGGDVAEGFAATFMNAAQQEADRVGSAGLGTTPHVAAARLGSRGVLIGAGAVGIRGIRRHRSRVDA